VYGLTYPHSESDFLRPGWEGLWYDVFAAAVTEIFGVDLCPAEVGLVKATTARDSTGSDSTGSDSTGAVFDVHYTLWINTNEDAAAALHGDTVDEIEQSQLQSLMLRGLQEGRLVPGGDGVSLGLRLVEVDNYYPPSTEAVVISDGDGSEGAGEASSGTRTGNMSTLLSAVGAVG
jgi:hypothetical protein